MVVVTATALLGSPSRTTSQAPSRKWLCDVSTGVAGEIPRALRNTKRAWFTDTLEDVNGVANTIRKMTAAGVAAGGWSRSFACGVIGPLVERVGDRRLRELREPFPHMAGPHRADAVDGLQVVGAGGQQALQRPKVADQ